MILSSILFFFSSRRRHTRLQGDWSSDVCSSDLGHRPAHVQKARRSGPLKRAFEAGSRGSAWSGFPRSVQRAAARACSSQPSKVFWWALIQPRSEEHTSELQSPCNLVCRLLLEKKKIDSSELPDS